MLSRHLYSVLLLITTLILVAVVGFTLFSVSGASNFTSVLNPFYTLLWRCLLYLSIGWSWEYLVRRRVGDQSGIDIKYIVSQSRKRLLVATILFEALIVQNGFWSAVMGIGGILYGR
jgi:hypothetical protein